MTTKQNMKGKKRNQRSMRDKYWKQAMALAEQQDWKGFCKYVDSHRWLATAFMGTSLLPDYLAGEKEYGLLRLLCNLESVPVDVIEYLIARGARDKHGRAYLERLLVGTEPTSEESTKEKSLGDAPFVAAALLKTCDNPPNVIDKMQTILEEGVQDQSSNRSALAKRCIGRSQLFYDLMLLLYENDAADKLIQCLGSEVVLQLAADGRLTEYATLEAALS